MPIWKSSSAVFGGGTEAIRRLVRRKVRLKTQLLSVNVYDAIHSKSGTVDLPAGAVGFVANPHPSMPALLLAIPTGSGVAPSSFDQLVKTNDFFVVVVNEPTFKQRFEVEV